MNLNVASKSTDSNWSGRLMVREESAPPSLLYAVVHLFMFLSICAFATIGMVYHGDVPWLPPHSLDCCAGLHVALGFFCYYWPPFLVACLTYQLMDSFGLNESVSGHGAESKEATIGDCLEYLVGAALCLISYRLKPLHTLDPSEAAARVKNLIWSRWGLQGSASAAARPRKREAGFHLLLNLAVSSYFIVSLRMMPASVDNSEVVTKYRSYVRCCSNVHGE